MEQVAELSKQHYVRHVCVYRSRYEYSNGVGAVYIVHGRFADIVCTGAQQAREFMENYDIYNVEKLEFKLCD